MLILLLCVAQTTVSLSPGASHGVGPRNSGAQRRRWTTPLHAERASPPKRLPAYEEPARDATCRKCAEHGQDAARKKMVRGLHAGREYWGCANDVPCDHFVWISLPPPVSPLAPRGTQRAAAAGAAAPDASSKRAPLRLAGDEAQRSRHAYLSLNAAVPPAGAVLETLNGTLTRLTYRGEGGYSVVRLWRAGDDSKPADSGFPVSEDDARSKKGAKVSVGVKAVSCLATARVGEGYSLQGVWSTHPRFGKQFEAFEAVLLDGAAADRKCTGASAFALWLGSGVISGVGPSTANKVVKFLGEEAEDVLVRYAAAAMRGANDEEARLSLERLCNASGISKRFVFGRIAVEVEKQAASRAVVVGLIQKGVPVNAAFALEKAHGSRAHGALDFDAHAALLACKSWGFAKSDVVALQLGVPADSPSRLRLGLAHALSEMTVDSGHTAVNSGDLVHVAAGPLGPLATHDYVPTREALQQALRDCVDSGTIRTVFSDQGLLCLTPWLDAAEAAVAAGVSSRLALRPQLAGAPPPAGAFSDRALSAEQRLAVDAARRESLLVLVGGPGTGKTRTARSVVEAWRRDNARCRVALAAPTARGAAVLGAAIGAKASTLHRLLEWSSRDDGFMRNAQNPLEVDAVVVDEASMLDLPLASKLFAALPKQAKILFIGDPNQLPSVGPGALLRDLLACAAVPRAALSYIYRSESAEASERRGDGVAGADVFSEASDIARDATAINDGESPTRFRSALFAAGSQGPRRVDDGAVFLEVDGDDADAVRDAVIDTVRQLSEIYDPLASIQILAPMRRGPAGTASLNGAMQDFLLERRASPLDAANAAGLLESGAFLDGDASMQSPVKKPVEKAVMMPRDRVIQLTNDYDIGIFNGDIGVVEQTFRNQSFVANFQVQAQIVRVMYSATDVDDTVALAYALTVHKAQGAEYPVVIMPLVRDHATMLKRPLLYTAVTRAKRLLVLVGSRELLDEAVRHGTTLHRRTALLHRLDAGAQHARAKRPAADDGSRRHAIKITLPQAAAAAEPRRPAAKAYQLRPPVAPSTPPHLKAINATSAR